MWLLTLRVFLNVATFLRQQCIGVCSMATRWQLALKRTIDVVGASTGLVALSPVIAGVTVLEVAYHGFPPFFRQDRPGLHGKIFKLIKFRSMTNETDANGELLSDAERLTPFGRILRKSSLDTPSTLNQWH